MPAVNSRLGQKQERDQHEVQRGGPRDPQDLPLELNVIDRGLGTILKDERPDGEELDALISEEPVAIARLVERIEQNLAHEVRDPAEEVDREDTDGGE